MENIKEKLPNYITCNKTVLLDCDGILCNIAPRWIKRVYDNKEKFSRYLNFDRDITFNLDEYKKIMLRKNFYIQDNPEYINYKENLSKDEKLIADKLIYSLYDEKEFYKDLLPTEYGTVMSLAGTQTFVKKIYVVTRSFHNNNIFYKKLFIEKLFKKSLKKLEIITIDENEKKSDVISKLGNDICLIADDEVKNIDDIILNCENVNECVIQLPRYNYNKSSYPMSTALQRKNIKVEYFSPVFNPNIKDDLYY